MSIKKLVTSMLISICLCMSVPSFSASAAPAITNSSGEPAPRATGPLARLQEIREMDKSNLSRAEKKNLRKELRQLKKEMKERKNGIYLSVGTIIIIGLLLLLLL